MKPKAPGMKYRHYAPKADMVLVEPTERHGEDVAAVERTIQPVSQLAQEKPWRAGKTSGDHLHQGEQGPAIPRDCLERYWQHGARKETVAHNLFAVLREFR